MQPRTNKIFDSSVAAAGAWANISNLVGLSIHIVGLESGSNTYIEVSNNPYNLANPPESYILGYTTPFPTVTSPPISGVPITGDLTDHATYSPPVSGDVSEEVDVAFSADGSQCMWSPSCLVWNWVRVVKTSGGSKETIAWLFGQNG